MDIQIPGDSLIRRVRLIPDDVEIVKDRKTVQGYRGTLADGSRVRGIFKERASSGNRGTMSLQDD